MEKKLEINKSVFETLTNTPRENMCVGWIHNNFLEIGFDFDLPKEVKEEIRKIFDFYEIEPETDVFELAGQWYSTYGQDDWELGYTIYNDEVSLEVDELLGSSLDDFIMNIVKEEHDECFDYYNKQGEKNE